MMNAGTALRSTESEASRILQESTRAFIGTHEVVR